MDSSKVEHCSKLLLRRLLDVELSPLGVRSLCVHPGGVQTRLTEKMGKYPGSITPEFSVSAVRKLIDGMGMGERESEQLEYVMYDGRPLQW